MSYNNICVGIVLYNPNLDRLKANIDSIVRQVDTIFFQDNGSGNIFEIEKLLKSYQKVTLLGNDKNKGIAWALNRLCEKSIIEGYEWILTLDQDSVCPDNMIQRYKTYLDEADMLCPKIIDRNYGLLDGSNIKTEYVKECITSGCLLNLKVWKEINGFDEAMFIDGVDFEFCYRMKQAGLKILRVNDVILYHEIGNITIRRFFGLNVLVKNHSAFRKYYIAKNIIYMARKKKNIFLILKGILQEIKLLGIVILYEDDKLDKIRNINKGIRDGFNDRVINLNENA